MASEDTATPNQIGHLYAVIKTLKINYKEFEKEHDIKLYGPRNKPSRGQVSEWIEELEALEAEQKAEATQPAPAATTIPTAAAGINQPELPPPEQKLPPIAPKPTVPELIAKYTDILAQVTVSVNAEDRIPDREKGYGYKFVFDKVTAEMQTGGDREEQA